MHVRLILFGSWLTFRALGLAGVALFSTSVASARV
jgi:hypothetical protein